MKVGEHAESTYNLLHDAALPGQRGFHVVKASHKLLSQRHLRVLQNGRGETRHLFEGGR